MNSESTPLVDLLANLSAELRVHDNPERRALGRLGPLSTGGTEQPHHPEALRIWKRLLDKDDDDLQTLHHLAILHHARAFDREMSSRPKQADADWRRALDLWHQLWSRDDFWTGLAVSLDDGVTDPFPGVRQAWPGQMLDVHFAIAFDDEAKHYRRRHHLQLALDAPFPREEIEQARARAYARATRGIAPEVWEAGHFDAASLEHGIAAVLAYLEVDDAYPVALVDLLGLLTQLQTAYVQQANAIGSDERTESLRLMQVLVSRHTPHVRRLEEEAERLEPEVLGKLVLWHSRAGQALRMLDEARAAAEHYRRGYQAASRDGGDDEKARDMQREWLICVASEARGQAEGGEAEQARELLASVALETWPPLPRLLRAQTYLMLGDLDEAERDGQGILRRLREPEQAVDDLPDGFEDGVRQLLDQVQQIRRGQQVGEKLETARKSMSQHRWEVARDALDEVLELDDECSPAYFLRAQCRLEELELEGAADDAANAAAHLPAGDAGGARQAIQDLRAQIVDLESQVSRYGGVQAFRLQQQAVEAFNDDRFAEAAKLLGRALKVAHPRRRRQLQEELRTCLRRQAADVFDPARAKAQSGDFAAARRLCEKALDIDKDFFPALFLLAQCHLEERDPPAAERACQRAAEAARAMSDRDAERAANQLLGTARQLRRAVDESGGAAAFDLRQEATQAFNAGRLAEAEKLLRQALGVAAVEARPRLEEELQLCSRQRLASLFGPATSKAQSGDFEAARRLCEEALDLDREFFPALFLLAQCQARARDFDAAESTCERAAKAATAQEDRDAQRAAKELLGNLRDMRRSARERQRLIDESGGEAAFELRQQAAQAMQGQRFDLATDLMRQALGVAKSNKTPLRQELATCLSQLAVVQTNGAMLMLQKSPGRRERKQAHDFLRQAEDHLVEATRLDKSNTAARDNLQQVRAIRAQVS